MGRGEIWRWWSWQFSHGGISHVGLNTLLALIFGIPLEGFHGSWRMVLMFNLGVFGGSCAVMVWDVHRQTVGMSGGVYALLGIMLADLIMNWSQKSFRYCCLMMLLFLA